MSTLAIGFSRCVPPNDYLMGYSLLSDGHHFQGGAPGRNEKSAGDDDQTEGMNESKHIRKRMGP